MNRPEVSVIMAIKDSARFVRAALDSIAAQSFPDYEVIVVDGDSTDGGPAIARSYAKTVCIPQQGTGFAHAWNRGIAAACAPLIAFLDSDDLWTPRKLELQLALFRGPPEVEYVFGRTEFFVDPGQSLPRGFRPELLETSHLIPMQGSSLIARAAVNRVGPFDETMRIASDIPWLATLRETAVTRSVDEVVLRKRLHAGSVGQSSWAVFRSELLRVAKDRAAKQRLAARAPTSGPGEAL